MKFGVVRIASIGLALVACYLLQQWASANLTPYLQSLVFLAGGYVTLAVSLNLINGITGQFSIGHAAFYMIGAYTTAFLTATFFQSQPLDSTAWVVLMAGAGAIAAGIAGLVVGLPSLRLRGDYLAIVTLGFGEIIRVVVQNVKALGGSFGIDCRVDPAPPSIMLIWLLAILTIAICRNLLKTAHGLPFLAVREDEIASSAMGVQVTKAKVTAFIVGSMFAGAAGAVYAPFQVFITPLNFDMYQSFIVLTMVVMGGTGSITGAAVAGLLLYLLPEYLRLMKQPGTTKAISLGGPAVAAGLIGTIVLVWLLRVAAEKLVGSKWQRWGGNVGALVIAGLVVFIGTKLLSSVPFLLEKRYTMAELRMAIFALVLIALMLLRPQGIMAHHEFSWDGIGKWLKRKQAGAKA
ncbi:MAG: branched-chain amino acid ABC transporter permease [Fimbriimonadaceae bacterium]